MIYDFHNVMIDNNSGDIAFIYVQMVERWSPYIELHEPYYIFGTWDGSTTLATETALPPLGVG